MTASAPRNAAPSDPASPQTLGQFLDSHGMDPTDMLACRVTLNPRDADADFRSTADLLRLKCLLTYARMQDGRRLGIDRNLLLFVAEPVGAARLFGHYHFRARRRGIAPGDIVYDYDAAHLLHSFIARARHPTFYDAFELPGLDAHFGTLAVSWPAPMMRAVRPATDRAITLLP